jgi:hypothetical protein
MPAASKPNAPISSNRALTKDVRMPPARRAPTLSRAQTLISQAAISGLVPASARCEGEA